MINCLPFKKRALLPLWPKKSRSWDASRMARPMITVLVMMLVLQANAIAYAQKISISIRNATLKEVFKEIRKQTGQDFIYNNEVLERSRPVTINVHNETLEGTLKKIFAEQPLSYEISGQAIIVKTMPIIRNAPDRTIEGKVTSSTDNEPVIGATVSVKGRSGAVMTDANGHYAINLPSGNNVLVFKYIGFITREVEVGSGNSLDVKMIPGNQQLEEVVVQAYGTIKRGALTNSVATIGAKEIEKRPITSVTTALAGAAPGIQTTTGSGQPGSGVGVSIRGFGSINAGTDVLYVVDGAPFGGAINNLNPNDIESISVLKDAAATALYGSRAANGVVLITTKSGIKNKDVIEARATGGITSRGLANYEKVDAFQYYPLIWESMRNQYLANGQALAVANQSATDNVKSQLVYNPFNVPDNQIVRTDGTINPSASFLYPDDLSFRKAMQQTGVRQNYSLGLRGGAERSSYYGSVDYLNDKGYSKGSDFNRITGRAKLDLSPKKWLKAGINMSGTISKTLLANEDAGINENPFYVDLLMAPIYPVYKHDAQGNYVYDATGNKAFDNGELRPVFQGRNIVAETMLNQLYNKRNAIGGRTYLEVTLLPGLKATANLAVDVNNYEYLFYRNPTIGDGVSVNGRTSRTNTKSQTLTINQLLNYNRNYGKHSIDALAGHEYYTYRSVSLTARRDNQVVDGPVELDNYANPAVAESSVDEDKLESFLSRFQYSYDNRYFLTASLRTDASSRFAASSRWGTFWSLGGGWQIHNESFMKPYTWIDLLKLRSSYGEVGSNQIGFYPYQSFYNIGNNNNSEPGMTQSRTVGGGEDVQWEINQTFDVAVEFGLFKNRINGTVEYFRRGSRKLLFNVPLALSTGRTSQPKNIGSLNNSGFEIQLSGDPIRSKNFVWNVAVNWTKFKNRITKLPEGQDRIISGTKNRQVGHSVYDYWLRDWYGVNPDNGLELYYADPDVTTDASAFTNSNGDRVTSNANAALYRYVGSAIPNFYGSLGNTFTYKNFSLNFLLMYQVGGRAFDSDYQSLMYNGSYGRALHIDALKRWQKPGDITDVPIRNTGTTMYDSDRWLIDASAVSLRTASLTYTLPRAVSSKAGVSRAQCFFTGENLFILSKRKGLDPTQSFTGVSSYTYAPTRILTLGLNITL
ncbi:TonB-dependent receptor [Mucilaginibacter daejeonensis]|uniref:TonB-dependent receptor n=1 Tax=Mucilaginibacter daejeonensis TaxID=398049 RepID=UPI001D178B6D|nr:TonB-dependent receptor [Mucilaginibacter daejeonensis]UEG52184.1 TonB-dependent receptor [Mucilaginibacter daejeonensis]